MEPNPSTQVWGRKEAFPARQVRGLPWPSVRALLSPPRTRRAAGPRSGARVARTWQPSAGLRGAVRGTSRGAGGRWGRVPGGREGAKDLALSFSAVSLVGRGGTYDLALDQLSYWSGQTSVRNSLGAGWINGTAFKTCLFLFSFEM